MKKILILCVICFMTQTASEAKDYVKHHIKEMKKSQQYSATNNYFLPEEKTNVKQDFVIKDPKLIKLGDYEEISSADFKSKKAKDEAEYKKIADFLAKSKVSEYHMQAYGKDFYHVYRIAERIIRANNLDFVNWRLSIKANDDFNAYNSNVNSVTINTGAYDTFRDNDDALALLIGHELSHGLLGHQKRKAKYISKIERARRMGYYTGYQVALKRYKKASRDMEFTADVEGAKLALKAGYDLSKAKDLLSYLNTITDDTDEWNKTHPNTEKRIANFNENKKYFMEDEWRKQGEYNIYNSKVLKCEKSSNRNSVIVSAGKSKSKYYQPEDLEQLYLRLGYKSYVNGEFRDANKYFEDYLKINKGNYAVYLYTSYANEGLYKQTGKEKYLKNAKLYADYAKKLNPESKYVKEQILSL